MFIYNSQTLWTTQIPINSLMDKHIVAYPYNVILINNERNLIYWYTRTDASQHNCAE